MPLLRQSRLVSLNKAIMAGIITQVSQTPVQANIQPPLLTRLSLDLRGKRFSVDRETIMNLPESVLLCLFPNGLVLSRQATSLSDPGAGEHAEEEEVYGVDVRLVETLSFLLSGALIWRV
jgi:hypothetical protein